MQSQMPWERGRPRPHGLSRPCGVELSLWNLAKPNPQIEVCQKAQVSAVAPARLNKNLDRIYMIYRMGKM